MSLTMERNLLNVYDFIVNFRGDMGYPPSIREIMTALQIKSTSSVHSYLKKLDEKGYIRITTKNKSRAIELPCASKESLAFALPAVNHISGENMGKALSEYKTFNSELLSQINDLFIVKMPDDTLEDIYIRKNDYLIVKKTRKACKHDLLLYKDSSGCFFRRVAENKRYIAYIQPDGNINEQTCGVIGTVVCLIRNECIK